MLAKDPDLLKFTGRKASDTPIASLELKVKNRANFDKLDAFSDKDSPDYVADEKVRAEAVKKFYADNPNFRDDTRRIDAIEKGTGKIPIPEATIKAHVDYMSLQAKEGVGSSSAEVMLFRLDNPDYDKWRQDAKLWDDNALKAVDTTKIPGWRIDVKYADQDTAYQEILDKYGTKETDAQKKATEDYLKGNDEYWTARLQRDAYGLGVNPDKWVAVSKLDEVGSWKERYYQADPLFLAEVNKARMAKGEKPLVVKTDAEIKPLQYDQITEKYKDQFKEYEAFTGTASQIAAKKKEMFIENPEFKAAYYRREAYDVVKLASGEYYRMPESLVQNYVEYQFMEAKGYEQERYLKEHRDLYTALRKRNQWKSDEPKWAWIPTKEVETLYDQYNALPNTVKTRQDFRAEHLDLDAWMVLTEKVEKSITETRRRAGISSSERLREDLAEKQSDFEKKLAEINKRVGVR